MFLAFKKKGKMNIVLGLMIGAVTFIFGLIISPAIKGLTTDTRTSMLCGTAGLSTGVQMTCIAIDIIPFMFLGLVMGSAWYYISMKDEK